MSSFPPCEQCGNPYRCPIELFYEECAIPMYASVCSSSDYNHENCDKVMKCCGRISDHRSYCPLMEYKKNNRGIEHVIYEDDGIDRCGYCHNMFDIHDDVKQLPVFKDFLTYCDSKYVDYSENNKYTLEAILDRRIEVEGEKIKEAQRKRVFYEQLKEKLSTPSTEKGAS